jgi:plastocyanin domain-containing protein
MSMLAKVLVTASGLALIALVNWYFFFSRKRIAAPGSARKEENVQEVRVVVKGGYSPDVIVVRKGIPVRLEFYREETAECSDAVVFEDFGVRQALPAYQTTAVEFTPQAAGEFNFTCGKGLLKGKLIVR